VGFFRTKSVHIILYMLGFGLLSGLSLWQYQRGLEKQEIALLTAQAGEALLSKAPLDWGEYVYRQSMLEGQWLDSRSFILENRVYKQRVGFEVLTPFKLSGDGSWILVNRGWVATIEEAAAQPESGPARLQGVLYLPEKGMVLGETILPDVMSSESWPKKALYIDLQVFSEALGEVLTPTMLVLDQGDPSTFVRIWEAAVMPAAKHFGYAVQWLGLAITFLIYGVIWFRRRAK
jgi:surfeit locus 1 family protein